MGVGHLLGCGVDSRSGVDNGGGDTVDGGEGSSSIDRGGNCNWAGNGYGGRWDHRRSNLYSSRPNGGGGNKGGVSVVVGVQVVVIVGIGGGIGVSRVGITCGVSSRGIGITTEVVVVVKEGISFSLSIGGGLSLCLTALAASQNSGGSTAE